jgi:hypothetical protein
VAEEFSGQKQVNFYESAYQAGARLAGWDIGRLTCTGGITDPRLRPHKG